MCPKMSLGDSCNMNSEGISQGGTNASVQSVCRLVKSKKADHNSAPGVRNSERNKTCSVKK